MEELKKALQREVTNLERIKKAAEADLKCAAQGTLRIAHNKNTVQYYWRKNLQDRQGTYIRKKEEKLIKSLAQKDYAQKVCAFLEGIIREKKKELQEVSPYQKIKQIYGEFSEDRQKLITPYILEDDEYAAQWEERQRRKIEKVGPIGKFSEVSTEIYTEKGEHVRSKSEKILADKLYMMQVPYVYEPPLYLEGYGYIKPDFIVLDKKTRKEYYWEHLGMMDDEEYCEKAIKKIENLEKHGIFPGKNLILTYETKEHPMNMKIVEKLVEEYLL